MSRVRARPLLYGLLLLFLVVRHDLWWWNDARFALGLPIGLTYHIGFCLFAALLMGLLVLFAWPDEDRPAAGSEEP